MKALNKLMSLKAVIEATTLGRTTIYHMSITGEFPKPIKIAKRRKAWLESEVQDWIDSTVEARA